MNRTSTRSNGYAKASHFAEVSSYLCQVLHYTELPPEGATLTSEDPPPSWPEKGAIEFKDVEMAYREGLPLVLKGVSFDVKAGEKVSSSRSPP